MKKPNEFHTAEVYIIYKRWVYNSICISGFRGTGDVVDVDAGVGTINDDPMAMYLGYLGV
jgi:hypothetical protein